MEESAPRSGHQTDQEDQTAQRSGYEERECRHCSGASVEGHGTKEERASQSDERLLVEVEMVAEPVVEMEAGWVEACCSFGEVAHCWSS